MRLKVSSAKWRPFCLGLNELSAKCDEIVWVFKKVYSTSVTDVILAAICDNYG